MNLHGVWVLILGEDNISTEVDSLDEDHNFVDTEIDELVQ